jgi:Na+/proline symporter
LFLISRGLSTGISIYAPSIIISSLIGWNIYLTNIIMGGLLIIYTVTGGSRSVAYTQKLQFVLIMAAMMLTAYMVVRFLPGNAGFDDAIQAGKVLGKMNPITSGMKNGHFDWTDKYNIWSGILGGFFLSFSYFGTDQSQVGRYLTAKSIRQSRAGLLMNGLVKVPMQFFILLVGVLILAFYQYKPSPIFFNKTLVKQAKATSYKQEIENLEQVYDGMSTRQAFYASNMKSSKVYEDSMVANYKQMQVLRTDYKNLLKTAVPAGENSDVNYIFLYFVTQNLPKGLVGLLIAVIILASRGSIAAALNSLASCTVVDIHQRLSKEPISNIVVYKLSWQYALGWGLFSIAVAMFATNMGSLIEAVNILGSLFYGVILGVFLVAFFVKYVKGNAVFWAAVISQLGVITVYKMEIVSFLWLNVIGAVMVVFSGIFFQLFIRKNNYAGS